MRDESSDVITHCCWAMDPKTNARCTLPPGHKGAHYTPYVRRSWDQPGKSWLAK
ncbi:hypothetical protein ABT115_15255 [Streptomyces sp. NPDC001832]|uniref:hypothetical protein n=1 Tax=Streptomyces sp. NPDC001832 TaxID=3154527 RepID=UPI003317A694